MTTPTHHNVFIIGSGPAGYTAGLYSARADLNPIITAGLGTVAMRIPAVDVTRAVIERFGRPVALTSANVHGEAPAMNASEAPAPGLWAAS